MSIEQTREQIAAKQAALEAELAALRGENAKLRSQENSVFRMKVTEKGGVSVYGLGKFPTTLYPGQWDIVFGHQDDIKAFMLANKTQLDAIAAVRKAKKTK